MMRAKQHSLWVLSELYYPEDSATGYYITGLAEALASSFDVRVLCAQPTYAARGIRAPKYEIHRGVTIHRCSATALNKDVLVFRAINLVTISISIFLSALRRVRNGDVVFVVTNPPTLPFVAMAVCLLKKARLVLRIEDVYPEAMIAAGMLRRHSLFHRTLDYFHRLLYKHTHAIIVLGRDMWQLVARKVPSQQGKITVIPNWADLDQVAPLSREQNPLLQRLGIASKFVVQYSGNMGRTHDLESLLDAAYHLRTYDNIHFLIIGSGAKAPLVRQTAATKGLVNVTVLPPQPRTELCVSLNACDIAIIAFVPGMVGVSVPSRMYNILAAGKPILAIAGKDSELAQLIAEENIGWVIEPAAVNSIAETIVLIASDRDKLSAMAQRARSVVTRKYSYRTIAGQYEELFLRISSTSHLAATQL
jgi:glycosyltransferase involved in cell wall biosynthesis